jgi:GR25 family glycosyltransferase involved in LPS biosynthesis
MDKIVYINMVSRADRRSAIQQEFKRVGFNEDNIVRFPASSYNGCPNSGCLLSHANALEMAYDKDYKNVLILEDDFVFIDDVAKIHADIDAFFSLNIEWDVVMFTTCAAVVSEKTNALISRISSSGNGAGYLVNRSMMLELSMLFKAHVEDLYTTKQHWVFQNDILWKSVMPTSQWYMFNHYLGYQKQGYSDLSQDQKIAIIPQIVNGEEADNCEPIVCDSPITDVEPIVCDSTSTNVEDKIQIIIEELPSYTSDSIVNSVISSFISRSNFGLQKYGTTLDREDLSPLDWIQHAQEEHMDAILYLEKLKTQIRETQFNKFTPLNPSLY